MYEKCKIYLNAIKSQITVKRLIMFACALLLIVGACQLIDGYLTARGNYQRAVDKLERTQRALDASRKLNQQLKASIAESQQLNRDAGRRIEQAQDYQRETGAGIERLETNQRETGARIGEGLEHLDAARGEIERGLELIGRIERANQTQQRNRTAP